MDDPPEAHRCVQAGKMPVLPGKTVPRPRALSCREVIGPIMSVWVTFQGYCAPPRARCRTDPLDTVRSPNPLPGRTTARRL